MLVFVLADEVWPLGLFPSWYFSLWLADLKLKRHSKCWQVLEGIDSCSIVADITAGVHAGGVGAPRDLASGERLDLAQVFGLGRILPGTHLIPVASRGPCSQVTGSHSPVSHLSRCHRHVKP